MPGIGSIQAVRESDEYKMRRLRHETIKPYVDALRDAQAEIDRLASDNERLKKLVTDYEELARKGFEMGQASRPLQTREAQ